MFDNAKQSGYSLLAILTELYKLNLLDIIQREEAPKPWADGEKIPWNEPEFSKRMLKEHLAQEHDAASRRFETIDKHVNWIHDHVLKGNPSRILDLGCGPGFYTNRLALLGHRCVGIDFSPASIAYAKEQAEHAHLDCTYIEQDIRRVEYGGEFSLVMSIFGEFNVFRVSDAKDILDKAHRALAPDGYVLLEPHPFETVVEIGKKPRSWHTTENGLFSEKPHLYLQENFWDKNNEVTIHRYYIIDAGTNEIEYHSSTMQAYTNDEYRSLLADAGFDRIEFYSSLGGETKSPQSDLICILAQKAAS